MRKVFIFIMIATKPKKKYNKRKKRITLEQRAERATKWLGSLHSLAVHTLLFVVSFSIPLLGIATFDRMLLVLTTVLSLEAIYLAIFIQMSVNKNTEDIEDIQEDIDEIQEDIDEIQEDVEDIEEYDEIKILNTMQETLAQLHKEIEALKIKS